MGKPDKNDLMGRQEYARAYEEEQRRVRQERLDAIREQARQDARDAAKGGR